VSNAVLSRTLAPRAFFTSFLASPQDSLGRVAWGGPDLDLVCLFGDGSTDPESASAAEELKFNASKVLL
jgi:hypothetical protein